MLRLDVEAAPVDPGSPSTDLATQVQLARLRRKMSQTILNVALAFRVRTV